MSSPVLALRTAIFACLSADAELVALLGGPRLYDAVPRGAVGLYVVFGSAASRDVSATGWRAARHELSLVIWSDPGGPSPALTVAARLRSLLDDADLSLTGWRLLRLRVQREETHRDARADRSRVTLHLEAATEAIA